MHKMLLNRATLDLRISPAGPVLVKGGQGQAAADPSLPDMAFVRTLHRGGHVVYLPGSSLKGVIRSHCERIARTMAQSSSRWPALMSCDPLADKLNGRGPEEQEACSYALVDGERKPDAVTAYRDSCFICQLFGNTHLASHIAFEDAYPTGKTVLEERNGVAIDRVFGSVAHGPFQFETLVSGEFRTSIRVHNFTCAHLGLVLLALMDLRDQHVFIGFGKSRGLGRVNLEFEGLRLESLSSGATGTRFPGVAQDLPEAYVPHVNGRAWVRKPDEAEAAGGADSLLGGKQWDLTAPDQIEAAQMAFGRSWQSLALAVRGKEVQDA